MRTVPDSKEFRRYSRIKKIETSVDKIFELSEVNGALAKVAGGGSKGKRFLKSVSLYNKTGTDRLFIQRVDACFYIAE